MTSSKKEILIIDDEVDFRLILAEVFVEQGYDVTTARNGKEAICHIQKSGRMPDLITVDVNMPVQDGMRFKEEIFKIYPDAPLIMISGSLPEKNMKMKGFRAYLTKPLDKFELLSVLENHNVYSALENPPS